MGENWRRHLIWNCQQYEPTTGLLNMLPDNERCIEERTMALLLEHWNQRLGQSEEGETGAGERNAAEHWESQELRTP